MIPLAPRHRWLHPALLRLQVLQFRSQCQRMLRGFRTPRRFALSLLAAALAVIWTAQTMMSILFREPADPDRLRQWIPMAMFAYVVYHWLKAALRPKKDPMEWTSAEVEWLTGSPLSRRDVLGFRLSTIASAAALKAACFTLVMLPDVHLPLIAAIAMWLALLVVDLIRLVLECFVWGLAPRAQRRFAAAAMLVAAAAFVSIVVQTWLRVDVRSGWIFAMQAGLAQVMQFDQQWWAAIALTPFQHATEAILATHVHFGLIGHLAVVAVTTLVSGVLVVRLDQWSLATRRSFERVTYERGVAQAPRLVKENDAKGDDGHGNLAFPSAASRATGRSHAQRSHAQRSHAQRSNAYRSTWNGVLTVAWMQMLGMRQYAGSLTVSFLVPAVLTLMPLVSPMPGISMALQIGGALAFYSYVLLPTALKFDFRRNLDRLHTLKRMPLSDWSVTLGQLAMPVLAITAFQAVVFAIAACLSSVTVTEVMIGLLLLTPANMLVFGLENLIFLLYPYRLSQEGIEIFLRTVLMFTGKGLLLLAALACVLGWSLGCRWICRGSTVQPLVFLVGLATATTMLAVLVGWLLKRAYAMTEV